MHARNDHVAGGLNEFADLEVMAPLCAVFRRYLKSQKLKYTPERADVLHAIIERDSEFEVDELMLTMRERGHRVSKATIYRTVHLLQDAGIITPVLFDTKQSHYQLVYGRRQRDYMVCVRSGRIVEFTNDELCELRDHIAKAQGWQPVGHRFQIYGISPESHDPGAPQAARRRG